MAERPDLEYWVPILAKQLRGATIDVTTVLKPTVLRQAVPGDLSEVLTGKQILNVTRHGVFIRFDLSEDLCIAISCMLAGRFDMTELDTKTRADVAMQWTLNNGKRLRYRDSVQMGKVYVCPANAVDAIPGYKAVGIDVLSRTFTADSFRALAKKRRDQVRVFLMDKTALDSLGNAYADEVLFAAGIHPKTWTRNLDDAQLNGLHAAIVSVLRNANAAIQQQKPPLDVKLRDFLKVRNRHKQPCPNCDTPIRKAGVHGHDSFFCPRCQPATRKSSIVDWRKR